MKQITKIRKMVTTMANRLKKMGLTLSAAFKKAWELVKGKAVDTKIDGVTKGNRQLALYRIATKYSPEAVSVYIIFACIYFYCLCSKGYFFWSDILLAFC